MLDNPLALLDPIYQRYAGRKPMAICEYAASHMAKLDMRSRPEFAIDKLSLVYSALPRLYPRVKLIDWFDMNTLNYPLPGKTYSNYALSENRMVRDVYSRAVSEACFLGQRQFFSDPPPPSPPPIVAGQVVSGLTVFSIFVKTYTVRPRTYLQIGNRLVYAAQTPAGAQRIRLDLRSYPSGVQPIKAFIYDDQNRFVTAITSSITIRS